MMLNNCSVSPLSSLPLALPLSRTFGLLQGFMVFCCTEHVNKAGGAAFN